MHPHASLTHLGSYPAYSPLSTQQCTPLLSVAQMKFHLISFKSLSRLSQQTLMTNNSSCIKDPLPPCVHENEQIDEENKVGGKLTVWFRSLRSLLGEPT